MTCTLYPRCGCDHAGYLDCGGASMGAAPDERTMTMDDLISRLRESARIADIADRPGNLYLEAADALTAIAAMEPEVRANHNWEQFGRWVLERFCEGDSEIEMMDIQDFGEQSGVLIPYEGGFDPDEHIDVTGACERGDPFYHVVPAIRSTLVPTGGE